MIITDSLVSFLYFLSIFASIILKLYYLDTHLLLLQLLGELFFLSL